jgi:hypothetical protein
MVVKPVDGSGGKGLVIGPTADGATLDAVRERLVDDPRGWIAQPVVQLSTVPTLVGGRLAPRHVDLRPFAVNDGTTVRVLPGGLTRVALPEGQLVVNSSQGGGSKDTWVLSNQRHSVTRNPIQQDVREIVVMTAPDTSHEDTAGAQQQQQQQQIRQARPVAAEARSGPNSSDLSGLNPSTPGWSGEATARAEPDR